MTVVDSVGTDLGVRARDLGIRFGGEPGAGNALTDVPGVEVGMVTLGGDRTRDDRAVRTGVTAILPRGRGGVGEACAAGIHSFNGNGELTGRSWIEESGSLAMPVGITNSHAVGAVHTGIDAWVSHHAPAVASRWMLPVVGETWDGYLNDINGGHVRPEHAIAALDAATGGPIAEGSVGGGTGMNAYGFKAGSGTASRRVSFAGSGYTVGAFIQANFGSREELTLSGVAIGRESPTPNPMETSAWLEQGPGDSHRAPAGAGSAIVVIATDAPLLPGQCAALARRGVIGLARTGTAGSHFSGDIMLAFSTANRGALGSHFPEHGVQKELDDLRFVPWGEIDPFYTATAQAVEESIWNALVAARDMTGRDGHWSYALPHDEIRAITRRSVRA